MPSNISEVQIPVGKAVLQATLTVPPNPIGIVLFAHGSGSSRLSPRNRFVAETLQLAGQATLLLDLLTPDEEMVDKRTAELRFDIPFLAERLLGATEWVLENPETTKLNVGYFGASTGAAAALVASAQDETVAAVVSRGGRPDLAADALPKVKAPTLLIVGGNDIPVIELNREALAELRCEKDLEIIPGATHLFEETGALEQVAQMAQHWFTKYLERSELEKEGAA
jgi:putative phosphoribosyl transferase